MFNLKLANDFPQSMGYFTKEFSFDSLERLHVFLLLLYSLTEQRTRCTLKVKRSTNNVRDDNRADNLLGYAAASSSLARPTACQFATYMRLRRSRESEAHRTRHSRAQNRIRFVHSCSQRMSAKQSGSVCLLVCSRQ